MVLNKRSNTEMSEMKVAIPPQFRLADKRDILYDKKSFHATLQHIRPPYWCTKFPAKTRSISRYTKLILIFKLFYELFKHTTQKKCHP